MSDSYETIKPLASVQGVSLGVKTGQNARSNLSENSDKLATSRNFPIGPVREQKLEEGQMLGGALLDAEARIGDLLKVQTVHGGSLKRPDSGHLLYLLPAACRLKKGNGGKFPPFMPSEIIAIGEELEEKERKEAKKRQKISKGRGKKGVEICHTLTGKTRDKVAVYLGVSGKTYEKAEACERALNAIRGYHSSRRPLRRKRACRDRGQARLVQPMLFRG
jgi:hypothetical protein